MAALRAIVAGVDTTDLSPVVMTSPDMATWTEVASWPGAGAGRVSVAGDTFFVATAAELEPDNYAYSTDGDTWTLASTDPVLSCVAWTGAEYVVAREDANGTYTASTAGGLWTGPTVTGTSGSLRALTYGGGVLVGALTSGANPPLFYSTDGGASWATHTPSPNWLGVYDVVYSKGRFVAVRVRTSAGLDNNVLTSTDGATWSAVSVGVADLSMFRVSYGGGRFVAVGYDAFGDTRTMTSPDGASWTVHTPTGLLATGLGPNCQTAYWAGLFGLVQPGDNKIYTSPDGVSWSSHAFTDRDWRGMDAGVAHVAGGTRQLGLGRGVRGLMVS